jgi:TetR/AcrR family transcriptional repressor of mexCD-oprJ operon
MTDASTDHRRAVADSNVEAILDATERVLGRQASPNIAVIAGEAGVSRVTVYAHFKSLPDVIAAVVERATRSAGAAIAAAHLEDGPAPEALDRMIEAGWHALESEVAVARAAATHLPPDRLRGAHESVLVPVRRLVDRGRGEGAFRTDLPAAWLVTTFYALLHAAADDVRAGHLTADEGLAAFGASVRELLAARRSPHFEGKPAQAP